MPIFRNDPNINVDGKLYGVPFTWGSAPMMYDPAVIPTPPTIVGGPAEAGIHGQGRHDGRSARQHDARRAASPPAPRCRRSSRPSSSKKAIDFLIELKEAVARRRGELGRYGRRAGARRRRHHLQRLGDDQEVLRRQGQDGRIHLSAGRHLRLARQLLHRQGRAEPRRRLRALQPRHRRRRRRSGIGEDADPGDRQRQGGRGAAAGEPRALSL